MKLTPSWNEKVELKEGKGRDPLALTRISDFLKLQILPGLTSLTQVARYYTFYSWAIKEINKNQINNRREFYNKMNKLESAWVIGGLLDKDIYFLEEKGTLGKIKARRKIEMSDKIIKVDFSLLSSNSGGVYNQNYKSPMYDLGLTFNMGEKDILTKKGKKIANSFEENIIDTEYFENYILKNKVPRRVLESYGKASSYLRLKETTKERNELIRLFLNDNHNLEGSSYKYSRRDTLLLYLDLYKKFTQKNYNFTSEDFRNIIYFKETIKEGSVIPYDPPNKSIQQVLEYWRFFQSHDYFTFCMESILTEFINETNTETGTTKDKFLEKFNNIHNKLKNYLGMGVGDENIVLRDIVNQIMKSKAVDGKLNKENSKKLDDLIRIDGEISEKTIRDLIIEIEDREKRMAYIILLLIIVILKYYRYLNKYDENMLWIKNEEAEEFGLHLFINEIVKKSLNNNIHGFLEKILTKIIKKHDYIAFQKLSNGNETFKFRRVGDRYIYERDYSYTQRGTRFNIIRNIFEDIGLIKEEDEKYIITNYGENILEEKINEK